MSGFELVYNEETGVWERKPEAYMMLEIATMEDFEELKAALEFYKKHKWIPVGERLPRPYMDVITLRQDLLSGANSTGLEYITIQRLDDIPEWSKDHMTWKNKVTHWMPLPELPKEG